MRAAEQDRPDVAGQASAHCGWRFDPYLPPNGPDLNPSEPLFAALKALLRKAADRTDRGGRRDRSDRHQARPPAGAVPD